MLKYLINDKEKYIIFSGDSIPNFFRCSYFDKTKDYSIKKSTSQYVFFHNERCIN